MLNKWRKNFNVTQKRKRSGKDSKVDWIDLTFNKRSSSFYTTKYNNNISKDDFSRFVNCDNGVAVVANINDSPIEIPAGEKNQEVVEEEDDTDDSRVPWN